MAVRGASERVTLSIPATLREELRRQPEAFGLSGVRSEASRLNRLLEAGARALKKEAWHAEQVRLYEEWADDPEHAQAVQNTTRMAVEDGLL